MSVTTNLLFSKVRSSCSGTRRRIEVGIGNERDVNWQHDDSTLYTKLKGTRFLIFAKHGGSIDVGLSNNIITEEDGIMH